jgi:predicted phosphodiesterase
VLAELEAGQKYEYRIKSILAGGGTCYADGWTFTTLDRDKKEFSFALFTDIHDQEWVLRQMWENSFPRKADFCVNLGDMSSAMNGSAIFYDGFLDTQVDLFASGTPIVWGRGNHELRGEGSALYYDYFNTPAGSSYYAFRHGDVLFIVLDGFSDIGVNDPFGCFDHDNFLADERSWLRELAGSDLFKNASYRVILAHFPPWDMASVAGCSMEYLIKDILDSTEEDERIHLMISGHTHVYSRIMPDGEIITAGETFKSQGGPMKLPFPVVINDGPGGERDGTIIWVNRSPDGLSVETLAPDGTVIDTFALR